MLYHTIGSLRKLQDLLGSQGSVGTKRIASQDQASFLASRGQGAAKAPARRSLGCCWEMKEPGFVKELTLSYQNNMAI